MNKQIEEIAKSMCRNYGTQVCASCDAHATCMIHLYAVDVYNAGYRKQERGEWIKDEKSKFEHRYHCTACDFYLIGAPTKNCPNCGAKMKGGKNG